ncbi:E3 ubiquitin-protein ligase TRIM39 [Periophthalmus magnuspinnatus]|uniref:E3 ubiquitin-protein ligase TRIM39 n=1 Tax=Periophthalmus magnuspinnatus TaxID=409849 RepID=UPI00145B7089|nr:E3 ubiquitin-protein ligase TRIM39 [Periophthalmus magnuspinnatus]
MALKSILKPDRRLRALKDDGAAHSSICAVRWSLPEDSAPAHSSAPTSRVKHGTIIKSSRLSRQQALRELRSLQECVHFIEHWKEQVEHVCKGEFDPDEGAGQRDETSDQRAERSLEESRKLIMEWADELRHVDELLRENTKHPRKQDQEVDPEEDAQNRIMGWARELQEATETCGVAREDLGRVLWLLGIKKRRLGNLLPLLEFITWSLLREDSVEMIPQLWLQAKQKTWETGIPRYIPNSVWSWICSAAADVVLDPLTHNPWLQLSDNQQTVQEAQSVSDVPENPQRFDTLPCVLAWEGYSYGRHYWEVDVGVKGAWRVGLTTAKSRRRGRFSMSPKEGYWALWRSSHSFYACTKPETELPVRLVPRRVGVYLDYDEGQISFYDAETKSHIYSFNNGTFEEKLYPLFAPLDGHTVMRIVPQNLSQTGTFT